MTLFYDFYVIYDWAQKLFMDNTYIGYYPYPFYMLFGWLTYIPREIAAIVWVSISIIILVAVMKRKAILYLFYYPLIFHVYYNQTSMIFWGLFIIGSPLSIAFMTLKPQLFLLTIPKLIQWFRTEPNKFYRTIIYIIFIQLPFLLMRPMWPIEFINNQFTGLRIKEVSPSLWAMPFLLVIWIVIVYTIRNWLTKNDLWAVAILPINPFIKFYDFVFLLNNKTSIGLLLVSFGIVFIAMNTHGDDYIWTASLLSVYVIIEKYISNLLIKENTNANLRLSV
jgi:hypothetical protein